MSNNTTTYMRLLLKHYEDPVMNQRVYMYLYCDRGLSFHDSIEWFSRGTPAFLGGRLHHPKSGLK